MIWDDWGLRKQRSCSCCFKEHEYWLWAACMVRQMPKMQHVTFVWIHSRLDVKVREANHRDLPETISVIRQIFTFTLYEYRGFINLVITALIFAVSCPIRIMVNAAYVMEKRGVATWPLILLTFTISGKWHWSKEKDHLRQFERN